MFSTPSGHSECIDHILIHLSQNDHINPFVIYLQGIYSKNLPHPQIHECQYRLAQLGNVFPKKLRHYSSFSTALAMYGNLPYFFTVAQAVGSLHRSGQQTSVSKPVALTLTPSSPGACCLSGRRPPWVCAPEASPLGGRRASSTFPLHCDFLSELPQFKGKHSSSAVCLSGFFFFFSFFAYLILCKEND